MTDTRVPRIPGDASLAFLTEGYLFGHRRFERFGTDAFRTRLMGRPVTLLRGHAAVRAFYEGDRFTREGAIPRSVVHSLQDVGSVQTLTGSAHHDRKSVFTRMLIDDEAGASALTAAFREKWDAAWRAAAGGDVDLRRLSGHVLADATLHWLGLTEPSDRREALAEQCLAMIDGAGSFGPRNWFGRARRQGAEDWAAETMREAGVQDPALTRVSLLARHLGDVSGDVAARELLNILRPTVAVSHFIVFAALAFHRHPELRERLVAEPGSAAAFAQEVRRTTPFFPAVGGVATTDVLIGDAPVRTGDWVLVDLFATDRHPREWRDAWAFDPARFERSMAHAEGAPHPVVAQGTGDYVQTHHCPGEPRTVDLLAAAALRLAEAPWSFADGDHRVRLSRLPARIRSERIRIG